MGAITHDLGTVTIGNGAVEWENLRMESTRS